MPMSAGFQARLFPRLPDIIKFFGTPFHILDEKGILETGENLKMLFKAVFGFQEYYAVKALPTPAILTLMKKMGFGADCSSVSELVLARQLGFRGEQIMFSSNDTSQSLLDLSVQNGGCILNLDDITHIERVKPFPDLICFRYNPGERRTGNAIIGIPVEAKYGLRHDQVIPAYKLAIARGATRFGVHSMVISNERNYQFMVENVRMLLGIMEMVSKELDIKFEFFNISGGVGIPYRPVDNNFDMSALAAETAKMIKEFSVKMGYTPKLFMECGRYMTGPHGVLVATVINRMSKYREYVGVDTSTMAANPRPAIYESAYHHITILDAKGNPRTGAEEVVDVVGPLCENNDKFAKQRSLPSTRIGDIMVQHDTGAHSPAMTSNYNGWLRVQQLLLRQDGSIELIKRAETLEDLFATFQFEPKVLR
ncbi:MAG TPA: diaminopimelate decarboxylase [Dehalococcoidales bacterium]|nr:diaminopimelate decarboxylase [Dehalococcoidales bacterium]